LIGKLWALACLGLLTVVPPAAALAPLEPETGCYFGVSAQTPDLLTVNWKSALGLAPATYGIFCKFPLNGGDETDLDDLVARNSLIGAVTLVTLEPDGGLNTVTQAACDEFAARCALYEGEGAKLMVRFGHEMNGSWYVWGQKPTAYIAAFRMVADAVHAVTKHTAMVWSPTNGLGYPFGSTTLTFPELDTNNDGQFTSADDPYSPYYPGDTYVDWVGMSVYHWGYNSGGQIENRVPDDQEFSNLVAGYGQVPDFYEVYSGSASTHKKPMVVPETSALFSLDPSIGGSGTNFAIKQAWWKQLFNTSGDIQESLDISFKFPMLKMIVWFNYNKIEDTTQKIVDWRLTDDAAISSGFTSYIQAQRAAKTWIAGITEFTAVNPFISLASVPASIPATGAFSVPLTVSSPTDADLIVNIVQVATDGTVTFVGGTPRATPTFVAAGTQNKKITVSASALSAFTVGGTYYWQAFLLPPGEEWPNIDTGTPRVKVGAVVAAVDPKDAEYAAKLKKINAAIKKAKKIKDPVAKAKKLKKLKAQLKALKKKYGK
jgi:hypothetical protein